jgi:hypothetical protein
MTTFGLQLPNFSLGVPDDDLFDRVVELARGGAPDRRVLSMLR